jgi:hypothetical protein
MHNESLLVIYLKQLNNGTFDCELFKYFYCKELLVVSNGILPIYAYLGNTKLKIFNYNPIIINLLTRDVGNESPLTIKPRYTDTPLEYFAFKISKYFSVSKALTVNFLNSPTSYQIFKILSKHKTTESGKKAMNYLRPIYALEGTESYIVFDPTNKHNIMELLLG